MASISTFERWEKDPLFSAAEEVQESADRFGDSFQSISANFLSSSGIFVVCFCVC